MTVPQPLLTTSKPQGITSCAWGHFDILAKGKTDFHCRVKETLFIQELEPPFNDFNVNVESERLMFYSSYYK